MNGILLIGLIVVLALLFGVIAVWAGVQLTRESNKPVPRPRPSPPARAHVPTDPWSVQRLRRGQREFQ
jgi:hypothetical protein